ncbi:hypothetical protein VNO77_30901 [Canavalia gladiata]|uniref:Uncharacterized protein n=1 Tax=Canavalia gladiata TaxID=3824 RepID=A0AAN9KQL5_CANGL
MINIGSMHNNGTTYRCSPRGILLVVFVGLLIAYHVSHIAWSDGIHSKGLGDLMAPPYPNHLMHPSSHAKLQEVKTWVNTSENDELLACTDQSYRAPIRLEDYSSNQPATMSLGSVDLQLRNVLGGVPVFSFHPLIPNGRSFMSIPPICRAIPFSLILAPKKPIGRCLQSAFLLQGEAPSLIENDENFSDTPS